MKKAFPMLVLFLFLPFVLSQKGCEPPVYQSCLDTLINGNSHGDGIYTIDPDAEGPEPELRVYCDMSFGGGGWTLAYKHSATVADANLRNDIDRMLNETNENLLTIEGSDVDYSNGWWNDLNASQLLAVVTKEGRYVYTAGFQIQSNDISDVWRKERFISSLSTLDVSAYDADLISWENCCQRFMYITKSHGGCPNDTGSLVVEVSGTACSWETSSNGRFIGYYPGPDDSVNYNAPGFRKDGEAILIFVR